MSVECFVFQGFWDPLPDAYKSAVLSFISREGIDMNDVDLVFVAQPEYAPTMHWLVGKVANFTGAIDPQLYEVFRWKPENLMREFAIAVRH